MNIVPTTPQILKQLEEERNAARKTEAYSHIPAEFRAFIDTIAWDRGHSSGEVDSIAASMAEEIKPFIDDFKKSLDRMKEKGVDNI